MALVSEFWRTNKLERIEKEWPHESHGIYEQLNITKEQLKNMDLQLQGHIVLPSSPDYNQARKGNPLYPAYPQIIVYCAAYTDVALALQWAHQDPDWVVTCRSGGHSTAGYSVNNGMVLDVSLINHVVIDPVQNLARIGSGANFRKILSYLTAYRKHFPIGGCPDVGIAGYMQGGGFGFTSREFGMNSDNVVEITMMLHNGQIVMANPYQNADLFWAVRGGTGNNFGVLLEAVFKLTDLYEVWGFALVWNMEDAPAVLTEMQCNFMVSGASEKLGYQTVLAKPHTNGYKPSLVMVGMYNGPREEGLDILKPLIDIGNPQIKTDHVAPFDQLNESLLNLLNRPTQTNLLEMKKAGYIGRLMSYSDWKKVTDYFSGAENTNAINLVVLEPYGGAINSYPVVNSAFIHRNVYTDFFVDSFFVEDGPVAHESGTVHTTKEQAQAWLDGYMEVMAPFLNGHVYQNYPHRDFPNYRWAYFGDAFNSLLFVKEKYDPYNFFRFPQSITPYPEDGEDIKKSDEPSMFSNHDIVFTDFTPPKVSLETAWAYTTA